MWPFALKLSDASDLTGWKEEKWLKNIGTYNFDEVPGLVTSVAWPLGLHCDSSVKSVAGDLVSVYEKGVGPSFAEALPL